MKEIFTRRSVRTYKEESISKETLDKLVRAGMQAPSATNQQPWKILVVTEREKLIRLSAMSKMLEKAGACIIIFYDTKEVKVPEMVACDLGACTQNILLECVSLGLGACWIGMPERQKRHEVLREVFHTPDNLVAYSVLSIGYPLDEDANHFLDRFDETKVFYESI